MTAEGKMAAEVGKKRQKNPSQANAQQKKTSLSKSRKGDTRQQNMNEKKEL